MPARVKFSQLPKAVREKLAQESPRKPRKQRGAKRQVNTAEAVFIAACKEHGLPVPQPEWRFHAVRRWRLDWAWINEKVALEIDGGAWNQGRHTRGKGFIADQEKSGQALLLGWKVFHCTPDDVQSGAVFALLRKALLGEVL